MKTRYKFLSVILTACMVLCMMPMVAFAEEIPTRKTSLDLSVYTEMTDMLDKEGWKWEPAVDGGVLTLRNCYIQSDDNFLLTFADNSNVTIILEGENTLETTSTVFGAMIHDRNSQGSLSLTIRGGEGGSLNFQSSSKSPYGIAGKSIRVESGTISSNIDFCTISGDFTMSGGTLLIDSPSCGIYTNNGNVTIEDGMLDIKAANTGIWTVGINASPDGSRNVYINGGTVKIEAGSSGIQTFKQGELKDTCDVYINGGDVDITSDGMGIAAKDITIDSDGRVRVHGKISALYAGEAGIKSKIDIKRAAVIELTGGRITYPEQSSADGLKNIVIGKADYTAVEEAVEKAEGLNPDLYLDFSAVSAAVGQVDGTKTILEQDKVHAMAEMIENAIAALKYKDADYGKVEVAIKKAEALNKDEYKDVSKVEAAINAVVYGKNITEQSAVDAMAEAIEKEISVLEKKPAPTPSEQPSKPSKPSKPEVTPGKETKKVPQTGDFTNTALWITQLLVSAGGLTGAALVARKRKRSKS